MEKYSQMTTFQQAHICFYLNILFYQRIQSRSILIQAMPQYSSVLETLRWKTLFLSRDSCVHIRKLKALCKMMLVPFARPIFHGAGACLAFSRGSDAAIWRTLTQPPRTRTFFFRNLLQTL